MLTPFGIAARKLRLDKGMRLLDLAQLMGCSASFISAIETGRKAIPDGYVVRVSRAMNLTPPEIRSLRRAADQARKEVRLDKLPAEQRELVAAFARRLDDIPADMMRALKKVVLKSLAGEIPFERKRRGLLVPPQSTKAIRAFADQVRSVFVDDEKIEFPIMDVLEFRLAAIFDGFYVDIRDAAYMGDLEGQMLPGENGVALREDVYDGAWAGNRRDRFTVCHELGHFLMHRSVTMARARDDTDKIFCDSEWQADTFAGTLMMSPRHLPLFSSPAHAADLCNMNPAATRTMWAKYQAEGLLPPTPPQPSLFRQAEEGPMRGG
jgi:transcriptional regulator with XRE-family HTH domain